MPGRAITLRLLTLLAVLAALEACATPGKPHCGFFDRGYPLCGI